MIKNRFVFKFLLVLIAALSFATLAPPNYIPFDTTHDKPIHAAIFFIVTLLGYLCFRIHILVLASGVTVLAVLSELSQRLSPYRSSNWLDLKADMAGIAMALFLLLAFIVFKRWRRA